MTVKIVKRNKRKESLKISKKSDKRIFCKQHLNGDIGPVSIEKRRGGTSAMNILTEIEFSTSKYLFYSVFKSIFLLLKIAGEGQVQ